MNFKNLATLATLSAGAAVTFSALPAHAFSFSILGYECPTTTCVDLAKGGYDVSGGGLLDPADDKKNTYLTPGSDNSKPVDLLDDSNKVTSYNVTSKVDDPTGAASPIVVSGLNGAFDFFWGSVDTYNKVEFFDGDTLVGSVTGSDIAALAGLTGNHNKAGNFMFDAYVGFEGLFDSAKLSIIPGVGTGVAFEVATKAVPEPATLLGLAAVGLVSSTLLRKRNDQDA